MYILATAIKNLRRYAGRYLLFGALIFVVLAIGAVSFAADLVLEDNVEALMHKYGADVVLRRSMVPTLAPEDYLPVADLEEIGTLEHHRYHFGIFQHSIALDGKTIDGGLLQGNLRERDILNATNRKLVIAMKSLQFPQLRVLGINFDLDPDVNHEKVVTQNMLVEGRLPVADNEVTLNHNYRDLTALEGVGVGSTLTLTLGETVKEYTIVGILGGYGQNMASGTHGYTSMECPIVMTYAAAESLRTSGVLDDYYFFENERVDANFEPSVLEGYREATLEDGTVGYVKDESSSAVMYSSLSTKKNSEHVTVLQLKSYTLLDSFRSSVAAVDSNYSVRLREQSATQMLSAYNRTARVLEGFALAVIVGAAVVILIMSVLAMHERRYEIGVLLSMGMGKGRISALFALENILFVVVITALAYAAGIGLAPIAVSELVDYTLVISRELVAAPVAEKMLALAVGLALPGSLVSALAILRFKPMTILRSRS